ncbi:MAG: hypothetical protein HY744_28635 [Deltaproteobacteria bacterium]|nr:hypothetical protein [Deltaproteobacteria bacterium]
MDTTSIVKGLAILGIAAALACSSNGGGGGGDGGASSSSSGGATASCASLCAKAEAANCPNSGQYCEEDDCSESEAGANAIGCSNEFDAYLECADGAPICSYAPDACKSEGDALVACFQKYLCTEHPQDPACGGVAGGPPSGSGGGIEE